MGYVAPIGRAGLSFKEKILSYYYQANAALLLLKKFSALSIEVVELIRLSSNFVNW